MKDKPVVAHYKNRFFEKSETFIYNYIANSDRFSPICLADTFVNLKEFPFDGNLLIKTTFRRRSVDWVLFKAGLVAKDCRIRRAIRRHKVRLLHAHFGTCGIDVMDLKGEMGIPLVTNFYGCDLSADAFVRGYKSEYES